MPIVDDNLIFRTSGASGTENYALSSGTISGGIIDLGSVGNGLSHELMLRALLTKKVTTGGTMQVVLLTGSTSTGVTKPMFYSPVTSVTSSTSTGKFFECRIPVIPQVERYIAVNLICSGGSNALTGGTAEVYLAVEH